MKSTCSVLAAGALLLLASHLALAGPKAAHLEYQRDYAEALVEARLRNVPVLVTRQKDE